MSKTITSKKQCKKTAPAATRPDQDDAGVTAEARLDALRVAATEIGAGGVARWSGKRRAAGLRRRMAKFRNIYNAAWHVRYFQHGSEERRQQAIGDFWSVLVAEIESTKDREALLYAVADSITCSPHGLPWEG